MSKRIFAGCLAAVIMLLLAGGCGQRAAETVPLPTQTAEPSIDPHEGMVEVDDGSGGTIWITKSRVLDVFAPDRNAIAVSDDSAMYNGTGWRLARGVDVSGYQGQIDWQAAAADGMEFAVIRCGWRGYESGEVCEDDYFRSNVAGAQAAGLDVGVYFFSQATTVLEAAEEAVFTAKLLEGFELQLPIFFDWEQVSYDEARTDSVTGETLTECALEFCRLLQSAGYDTGIYTNLYLAYNYYDLDALAGQYIWLADPGSSPGFYYDHLLWQYSFSGTVEGIGTSVDLDVMYVAESAAVSPSAAPEDGSTESAESTESSESTEAAPENTAAVQAQRE